MFRVLLRWIYLFESVSSCVSLHEVCDNYRFLKIEFGKELLWRGEVIIVYRSDDD